MDSVAGRYFFGKGFLYPLSIFSLGLLIVFEQKMGFIPPLAFS